MMTTDKVLCLHGYRYSVYTRIVRVVLAEKSLAYDLSEVNPFEEESSAAANPHPFGMVPVLSNGGFQIYETNAITRYLDAAFPDPALTPRLPSAIARMAQVIAMIDAYGYRHMVRQVFEHRVFRPANGEALDEAEVAAGLRASGKVLAALESVAAEGLVLAKGQMTLAECHLAPMLDYFTVAPEGAALLARCSALSRWWADVAERPSLIRTNPGLPG
ncbi:Gst Glutathione S-transferase [Paracoccaceae bacterium]